MTREPEMRLLVAASGAFRRAIADDQKWYNAFCLSLVCLS